MPLDETEGARERGYAERAAGQPVDEPWTVLERRKFEGAWPGSTVPLLPLPVLEEAATKYGPLPGILTEASDGAGPTLME